MKMRDKKGFRQAHRLHTDKMPSEREFHLQRVIAPYREAPMFNLSPHWCTKGVE